MRAVWGSQYHHLGGLPGVPSQVSTDMGTPHVLVPVQGDPKNRAEDRKVRAPIPRDSHWTKYFSWWSLGNRTET